MKKIPLTKGYETTVSDADYRELSQFKWYYNTGYAYRRARDASREMIAMHRQIKGLERKGTSKIIVDHRNRDTLDNSRSNLRVCTQKENQGNRTINKNNTTGYKGVHFHRRDGVYGARIMMNGKQKHLGWFKEPSEAHSAYLKAAKSYYGTYARSS